MTDLIKERLLTTGQVAAIFNVDPQTVTRWNRIGRLDAVKTPGGHRRYREADVRALLASNDNGPGVGSAGAEE